ncbi:envelope stress response membrane protein PspC [Alteromonas oceanisediminis]|uniref:envelope stress response membrane protein PspC n=1 Tax=Alteromonas oceanisediminis TaxID=2836180 RepID=UPI001BDB361A|nr:envelope stress response membrane protein PspC [Alteromonas oceanisediminis]MBT0584871.1 envelope stress response membrane protein PspC [Alteromonas oceanisediminis]
MRTPKTLYRDAENGKIAGVCSGVAQYFGIETWLVRILTVTSFFLLAGPFVFVGYIACWFIMDKKPKGAAYQAGYNVGEAFKQGSKGWRDAVSQTEEKPVEVKSKVWQSGEPPRQAFHDIQQRFRRAEERLRKVETYVTSKEFQLNREINQL